MENKKTIRQKRIVFYSKYFSANNTLDWALLQDHERDTWCNSAAPLVVGKNDSSDALGW